MHLEFGKEEKSTEINTKTDKTENQESARSAGSDDSETLSDETMVVHAKWKVLK